MNQRVKALVEDVRKLTADEPLALMAELSSVIDDEPADGTPEEIEAAWMDEVERSHRSPQKRPDYWCARVGRKG